MKHNKILNRPMFNAQNSAYGRGITSNLVTEEQRVKYNTGGRVQLAEGSWYGQGWDKIKNIFTNQINSSTADIAEKFTSDSTYTPGTVMILGGTKEVTQSRNYADPAVAGIVTTDPAFIMNSEVEGDSVAIALAGRTPCKVIGPISKGELLTTSSTPGYATRLDPGTYTPGCVIAKAMENCLSGEHVIMVMIFTS